MKKEVRPLGLRIHLISMRIRILNSHWEKMDPDPNPYTDPGHEQFFKIYCFFLTECEFATKCFSFNRFFMLKLNEAFKDEEIFDNLSFLQIKFRF